MDARHDAVVRPRVGGPGHPGLDVDLVVDSGFTASLTPPNAMIAALGLVRHSGGGAILADGPVRQFELLAAEVAWDGRWRPVLADALDTESLIGMHPLAGPGLRVAVVPGGAVEIAPPP